MSIAGLENNGCAAGACGLLPPCLSKWSGLICVSRLAPCAGPLRESKRLPPNPGGLTGVSMAVGSHRARNALLLASLSLLKIGHFDTSIEQHVATRDVSLLGRLGYLKRRADAWSPLT